MRYDCAKLVLWPNEYDYFLKKYCELHMIDYNELVKEMDDTCDLWTQYVFECSKYVGAYPRQPYYDYLCHLEYDREKFFSVACCTDGIYVATITPYRINGRKNLPFINHRLWQVKKYVCDNVSYVIDMMPKSSDVTYDDVVRSFKDDLEKYLPEDFSWDEHIGIVRMFITG